MIGSAVNEGWQNPNLESGSLPVADREIIHEQTDRILADPLFRNAFRASNLLRFIVDRTLDGKKPDLKERIIGIEVFGRKPDYDTSNDSTVRVAANEVRKRLAKYYAIPAHENELRIEIPVRGYHAEFFPPGRASRGRSQTRILHIVRRAYVWIPALVIALALVAWAVKPLLFPPSALDRFWAPVVRSSGTVTICIGKPNDRNGILVDSLTDADPSSDFSSQQVSVSMMDVNRAQELASFLRRKGKESVVLPIPGNQLADLRSQPVILYGRFLNEWAAKLGDDFHFRFHTDSNLVLQWIEDPAKPTNHDWSESLSMPDEQRDSDYALISRIQDPTTGQWRVGIAGLTRLGSKIASQLVLDSKEMASIMDTHFPKNWDRKNLQIVVRVKTVQGNAGTVRVISTYAW